MIPEEKSEAVRRGLREIFQAMEFEDISRITSGHTSSLVYRIIVCGSPYLLKIITRTEDPTRHYTSMKADAEAGVAPRVSYTNEEDRISITDFVKTEPRQPSEALVWLPALLRKLHTLPPFGRASFLNDRYADLAVVANHVVTNGEEESIYLQQYFGPPPNQYHLARFHLMQQIAHLFYTMAFLFLGCAGKPIDWNANMPEFADCHRRMWAWEIDLANNDVKIVYGRVHWERLLRNVRQARYHEALRIVSNDAQCVSPESA